MDIEAFYESMPFARLLGVELTAVGDGHAEGRIEMREELSWNADRVMAHGGVTFTLADTVGGAALVSQVDQPVPTIDMRIDYLSAATGDLRAEADVVRIGGDVGTVDVDVYADGGDRDGEAGDGTDGDGTDGDRHGDDGGGGGRGEHLATARGVYKTG
jgi:uncharacterized protein (TIGR00369 family)